jgi:hypothetical protein
MSLMDVKVCSAPIGVARVEIDLGGGHVLTIRAEHDTDRYRNVLVGWNVPAHVTGPVEQVRDLQRVSVATTRLDLRTGTSR